MSEEFDLGISIDENFIIEKVQHVLNTTFKHEHPAKRKIDKFHNRLNFACPYCGDSHNEVNKKRGNIYINSLAYECFNEGCGSTFEKFLTDFEIDVDNRERVAISDYVRTHRKPKTYNNIGKLNLSDKLIPFNDFVYHINSNKNKNEHLKLIGNLEYNVSVDKYLNDRNIINKLGIFEGRYSFKNNKHKTPVMVYINGSFEHEKVMAYQIRPLEFKTFRRKLFSELYFEIYGKELDSEEQILFDNISAFFNILNVDFSSPVSVLEGYIDKTHVPNSVSASGINTSTDFFEENNLNVRYIYDNDDIGLKKSMEKIHKNIPVFLWRKYLTENKIRVEIKDINDLYKKGIIKKEEAIKNLDSYFSIDKYDLRWL